MNKPILCLDFDGVIHSYDSGWKGANVVPDPPVPGAIQALLAYMQDFQVAIYSSRSGQDGGIRAMQGWLMTHLLAASTEAGGAVEFGNKTIGQVIDEISWPQEKPPAKVSIDDRALTFDGTWPDIEALKAFKPWNHK